MKKNKKKIKSFPSLPVERGQGVSINVRAKKRLGQHFLNDETIAERIANSLDHSTEKALEIGPGMGSLTKYLLKEWGSNLWVSEVDDESVKYLNAHYPELLIPDPSLSNREGGRIIQGDFLRLDLTTIFGQDKISLVGNFPYNISSQILFKALDNRDMIVQVVGTFQKEVAKRICSPPGNRSYGILSVLIQTWYETEYLFDVPPEVFIPPPVVNSGVIRLVRKENQNLGCDEVLYKKVIKTAFNQRRKKLSNALLGLLEGRKMDEETGHKRAEELSWEEFVKLTREIANS